MKKTAPFLAFCALLLASGSANAADIEELTGTCSSSTPAACEKLEATIGKLTDQTLLKTLAETGSDRFVRVWATAAMDESNPALIRVAGDLGDVTSDTQESIARIKLAIQERRIRNRLPRILFAPRVSLKAELYSAGAGRHVVISGESVSFVLSLDRETLAQALWNTSFPQSIGETASFFKPALVDSRELLAGLLHKPAFTQDDLAEISSSEIPEVRYAAVGNLTDQALLAKIGAEDKIEGVRVAAVKKLTDQALLAKFAVEDKARLVRITAVEKLTDQALLARVAAGSTDEALSRDAATKLIDPAMREAALAKLDVEQKGVPARYAAVGRLTDQVALARIAVKDKAWSVRSAAVERLTDQAALAKIVVESTDELVRLDALKRLRNQAALAKIAAEEKPQSVREAALERLSDQAALARIAVQDIVADVRRNAVWKLTDEAALAKIAVQDRAPNVRQAAELRLATIRDHSK